MSKGSSYISLFLSAPGLSQPVFVGFPGMELFEEALQKWEQALSIRQRDSACTSTPVPWDSSKQQESMSENISEVGAHMLKGQPECWKQ